MCAELAEAASRETKTSRGSSGLEGPRAWTDTRLVRECVNGNNDAWAALIEKYKNLIFSIPIKYGFPADEANDIFQSVCLDLLSELPKLRKAKALPKWLIQVASHKCFHRKRQQQRTQTSGDTDESRSTPPEIEGILREAEEEQTLRDALFVLAPRCRRLVEMLFFEEPARPYKAVAASLGIREGSIGFIRQRCLERLRKQLIEAGFP
jgi:RNA polymerase sigma factor (sigma-70 family)